MLPRCDPCLSTVEDAENQLQREASSWREPLGSVPATNIMRTVRMDLYLTRPFLNGNQRGRTS